MPDARLDVMVRQPMADLWTMTPVDRVLPFAFSRGIKGARDRLRFARELRRESFDTAIVFPNSFDSALVPWLARIPERVGRPTDGRSLLLTKRVPRPENLRVAQQPVHYLHLIETWLGRPINAVMKARLRVPDDVKERVAETRQAWPETIIGLNPGSTYGSAKRWLPERFADIAARCRRELNAHVVIFGGPGDIAACQEVYDYVVRRDADAADWCSNLAGKTTITELAGWLEQCACLVTNDTGAMHVSAAVGTPVVAIFGPTDWTSTAPLGDNHQLIKTDVECAPCMKRECPTDHGCMKSITTDQVWDAVGKGITRSCL